MALRGTNQEFGRPYNRRIVLESIRLHGPIARGEIASRVGLTVQTVSTIVRELEEQGYILSLRVEPKGRGLPPATLRINPEGGYAVGIHITPLGINAALINLSGDVIESKVSSLNGYLANLLELSPAADEVVENLYMRVLCRPPTAEELTLMKQAFASSPEITRQQAVEDVLWSVLNTKEFLYNN